MLNSSLKKKKQRGINYNAYGPVVCVGGWCGRVSGLDRVCLHITQAGVCNLINKELTYSPQQNSAVGHRNLEELPEKTDSCLADPQDRAGTKDWFSSPLPECKRFPNNSPPASMSMTRYGKRSPRK